VPSDRAPRPITQPVPFGLLEPPPTATTTTRPPLPTVSTPVFFVRDGRVVPVPRQVQAPLSVPAALGALLEGPTDTETAAGVRTAISLQTQLLSTEVGGEVARLDLAGTFAEVAGDEQLLAVAQIVFTATAVEGVTALTFAINGREVAVPTADGTLKPGPVGRADFPTVAPA
jgi:spore germination protein GerM